MEGTTWGRLVSYLSGGKGGSGEVNNLGVMKKKVKWMPAARKSIGAHIESRQRLRGKT